MALSSHTTPQREPMEDAPDDSWQDWFQLYGPKLLLCARQWTRTATDAEDVVQEAFVRFWRHQRGLPGDPMALLVTSVRRAEVLMRDIAASSQEQSMGIAQVNQAIAQMDDATQQNAALVEEAAAAAAALQEQARELDAVVSTFKLAASTPAAAAPASRKLLAA